MHRLDFINDLQPEQVDVINRVTQPGPGNELFLVQGVAGSGKTTMAMHIARKLGADNHSLPLTRQATILFLTYNPRLAEYCANTLSSIPEVAEMVTVGGQGVPRRINVFGAQDFFMQALEADEVTRCLSDEECTSYLGLAASNRGVRNLLPSQIYSLIVTFLRGRPELIGLGIDELEKKIQAQIARSSDYRIYGEDLQEIRARLLKTYEDWKAGRLDRSDVAARFRRQADHVEEMLRRMEHVEAVELRTQSQYVLGDRVLRLAELTSWMKQVFAGFRGVAPISAQAEAYEQVWSGRRLSEDLWDSMRMD